MSAVEIEDVEQKIISTLGVPEGDSLEPFPPSDLVADISMAKAKMEEEYLRRLNPKREIVYPFKPKPHEVSHNPVTDTVTIRTTFSYVEPGERPVAAIYGSGTATPIEDTGWTVNTETISYTTSAASIYTTNNIVWNTDNVTITLQPDLSDINFNNASWWGNSGYARAPITFQNDWQVVVNDPLTPEEADRRLAATRAEQHKQAIKRNKAIKKGQRLLVNILNDLQRHQYAKHGKFSVVGSDGKVYVLRKGGTVHELGPDGRATHSHCIHLPYSYIDEDTLISLKLLVETNAAEFRRIANTSPFVVPGADHAAILQLAV